ncbi:hypothetical protein P5W99_24625 [Paraburkholderia sp. A3BS-1L]|uniref:hypothetical protein n=1 Tax=Paraburkholderia sp. A3BS-1L TaxID=3028375 RepID=UPI003DA7FF92
MWQLIGNMASLAGIAGISLSSLLDQKWMEWVALTAFLCTMGYAAWLIRKAFDRLSKQHYPHGYLPLSALVRFSTPDGGRVTYEIFRHIQVKTAYQKTFIHRFFWSGSKDPVIKSELQSVSAIRSLPGETTKEVTLTFPRVRMFNDVEVLHMRMEIDDSDQKSSPFLSMKVEQPLRLLNFRVELLHATKTQNGKAATITRRSLLKPTASVEDLGTVNFDAVTRSYSYQLCDPDPGWEYTIEWVKPNKRSGGRP